MLWRASPLFLVIGLAADGIVPQPPDMLEKALPGVLTIAVNALSTASRPMGAASARSLDSAYERVLDLSEAQGTGSGFVIMDGSRKLVITNMHVVEKAADAANILGYSINQTQYQLRFAGGDSFYDIAVLEFVSPQPGPEILPMRFRATDLRVGEPVYALGNPLGDYPYSVSSGILSGKNRVLQGMTGRLGYLQHTAMIIWGYSGGPLIDSGGEVVGINTSFRAAVRGDFATQANLNFALDGGLARRLISSVRANDGRLLRAFFGLEMAQTLDAQRFRKSVSTEVMLRAVVPGGPGEVLKGLVGGRIDRIGSRTIRNLDEATAALEAAQPGEKLEFEITLDGTSKTVVVTAGSMTTQNLANLGRHVMASYAEAELSTAEGRVRLSPRRAEQPRMEISEIRLNGDSRKRVMPNGRPPLQLSLIAVGFVPESRDREPLLYRVRTESELGAALRLHMVMGVVDLVVQVPGSEDVRSLRLLLSGDEKQIRRVLLY